MVFGGFSNFVSILLKPQPLLRALHHHHCSSEWNQMDQSGHLTLSGEKLALKLRSHQLGLVPVEGKCQLWSCMSDLQTEQNRCTSEANKREFSEFPVFVQEVFQETQLNLVPGEIPEFFQDTQFFDIYLRWSQLVCAFITEITFQ